MSHERTYRWALTAYPRGYRDDRAEEILGVLMEAPHRRTAREALSLVRQGVKMRLLGQGGRRWRPAATAAALALSTCLAALALFQVMDLLGYLLHGQADGIWVDPQWPAYALWLLTFGLLLARLAVPALLSATGAAVAYAAVALHQGWTYFPEDRVSPAVQRLEQLWPAFALLVPTVLLAVLLLDPRVGRSARDAVTGRVLMLAVAAGVLPGLAQLVNGVSQLWPVLDPLVVLLIAFASRGVFLRALVLVAVGFVYVPLGGLTDGSGSRLPHSPAVLAATLAVLPLLGLLAAVVGIPLVERDVRLRGHLATWLERLSVVVRGSA